jgi:uncharacterized membrane protein
MYAAAVLWHWAEFAVRRLHVVTAIAWIGSGFYFVALDLGLRRDRPIPSGAGRGMVGPRRRLLP